MPNPAAVHKAHSAAQIAFEKIGNANGSAKPQSDSNYDAYLHEYAIAKLLESAAKKRVEAALSAIMTNTEADESEVAPGTSGELLQGDLYSLTLQRNENGQTVSLSDYQTQLRQLGVKQSIIEQAERAVAKPRAGNRTFRANIRT